MPRFTRRREQLIDSFGGSCQCCGYDRCSRALHFHHKDNSEKAQWSQGRGGASLGEVSSFPERFLLLCANCHAEEHERLHHAKRLTTHCQFCAHEFDTSAHRPLNGRAKFCSKVCFQKSRDAAAQASAPVRFWKHVQKTPTCWIWTSCHTKGHPQIAVKKPNGKYSSRSARRISYELHRGQITSNAGVSSTCGNSLCVNPDHLQLTG